MSRARARAREGLLRATVKLPEQRLLPFRPRLEARARGIGEREQQQLIEAHLVLHDMGCRINRRLVVEVAPLGQHRELEMIAHEEQQLRGLIVPEVQAVGDLARHFQAGFGMMVHVRGLAHVVQQQRQVEHMRMLDLLENLLVAGMRRFGRVDDAVEVLDHLDACVRRPCSGERTRVGPGT